MASDTEHGIDFSCITDITPALDIVHGRESLAQAIARRTTSDPGDMFGLPDYGRNVERWLNTSHPQDLSALNSEMTAEALLDERVLDAAVDAVLTSAEFDEASSTIENTIRLVDENGPFELTISIDNVTTDVILDGTELAGL
jgi:hypothetical protein